MLKQIPSEAKTSLLEMYNAILAYGSYPHVWLSALITASRQLGIQKEEMHNSAWTTISPNNTRSVRKKFCLRNIQLLNCPLLQISRIISPLVSLNMPFSMRRRKHPMLKQLASEAKNCLLEMYNAILA